MLGVAVLTSMAEAAGPVDLPKPKAKVVEVAPQPFNAEEALAKLGVKKYALDARLPKVGDLLETNESKTRFSFSYPNFKSPDHPTYGRFVELKDFNPTLSAKRHVVKDAALMKWLEEVEPGDTTNFENTDMKALSKLVGEWIEANPKKLSTLGIKDVRRLTPRQAVNLAGLICTEKMRYNNTAFKFGVGMFHPGTTRALETLIVRDPEVAKRSLAAFPKNSPEFVRLMDSGGIELYFAMKASKENPNAETGVCRNYTEAYQAIWTALLSMQDERQNRMRNTYVKMPFDATHIWVLMIAVQQDGSLLLAQIDPTWADSDSGVAADAIEANLKLAVGDRTSAGLRHVIYGTSGVSLPQVYVDYKIATLAAYDLAARGQADRGAALVMTFVKGLPPGLREDYIGCVRSGFVDAEREKGGFRMRGATQLRLAIQAAFKKDGL